MGLDDEDTIAHRLNEAFEETNIGFLSLCNPGWNTIQLRDYLYYYGEMLGSWKKIIWLKAWPPA